MKGIYILRDSSSYARMGRLSAIITILPAAMAGGWVVGYFVVDRYMNSFPWGSIVATLLGAAAGFYEIVRLLIQDQRDKSSQA